MTPKYQKAFKYEIHLFAPPGASQAYSAKCFDRKEEHLSITTEIEIPVWMDLAVENGHVSLYKLSLQINVSYFNIHVSAEAQPLSAQFLTELRATIHSYPLKKDEKRTALRLAWTCVKSGMPGPMQEQIEVAPPKPVLRGYCFPGYATDISFKG